MRANGVRTSHYCAFEQQPQGSFDGIGIIACSKFTNAITITIVIEIVVVIAATARKGKVALTRERKQRIEMMCAKCVQPAI